MRWIITKDHLAEEGEEWAIGKGTYKGANVEADLPFQFRLYDDDGELYFEGRCGDLDQADENQAFAPLDWGMAYAGCTEMRYRKGNEAWQTL